MDAATVQTGVIGPKQHYVVLDGLRGVASVVVIIFHLFEAFSTGPVRQIINHGYLAVDFFFLLSGFVIAYAYDDRWGRMSVGEFFKRRLIRLQPMVILGTLLGAALWPFQDYSIFPKVASAQPWQVIGVMLLGFAMVPLPGSADIRGWGETYPLNGPAWSLSYEYVANILYALGFRKLSNRALTGVLLASGAVLVWRLVFGTRGDLIGGWTLDADGISLGMTRVMFPFFAGILLMRLGKRVRIKGAFALSSALLLICLAVPRLGDMQHVWINGLYEALCVIVLFPLIVSIGAGEMRVDGLSIRVARFFGDVSYPLYITHYPLIYIYTGWVADRHVSAWQGTVVGAGVFVVSVLVAWAALKLCDEPVRRWLGGKLLARS